MKNTLLIISFFALAIMYIGCKKDDPKPNNENPITSSVFVFFKIGASWIYDTYDSDAGTPHISQSFTINNINAQNYATVTWNIANIYSITQEWFADNTKFSMLCSQGNAKMLVLCDANPNIGETWTETWTDSSGVTTDSCKIIALNETVNVPAGTFTNCIKILQTTSKDPVYYKYIWFNFNVGVIKTEGTTSEDYPTILYEDLSSHN
jgi:hypothetical protein